MKVPLNRNKDNILGNKEIELGGGVVEQTYLFQENKGNGALPLAGKAPSLVLSPGSRIESITGHQFRRAPSFGALPYTNSVLGSICELHFLPKIGHAQ